ncbi:hypothetical protein C8F04DRAFT_1186269 [Mycena alexandri]|uniref:Uncharacterized protein n=1 Tax=Mycena alexandri TaxID=1745969 RepID=A0AAD6SN31_9AGAR|nr:hypothetical protein C8F04DRAFT_1186269 [Mycena alexandri]
MSKAQAWVPFGAFEIYETWWTRAGNEEYRNEVWEMPARSAVQARAQYTRYAGEDGARRRERKPSHSRCEGGVRTAQEERACARRGRRKHTRGAGSRESMRAAREAERACARRRERNNHHTRDAKEACARRRRKEHARGAGGESVRAARKEGARDSGNK